MYRHGNGSCTLNCAWAVTDANIWRLLGEVWHLQKMSLRSLKSTREILAQLKSGPGASKLPSNVSKIALTYAIRGKNNSAAAK